MDVSKETQIAVGRIKAATIHHQNLSSMHADIFGMGSWWDDTMGGGGFTPDPDLDMMTAIANDALNYLNRVLDDVRITPDMPEPVMLQVLNRRLNTMHEQDWCDRAYELGGPRIGAHWLTRYVVGRGIQAEGRPYDWRVHKAAVLVDHDRRVSVPNLYAA